ncbi:hypothetical protein CK203_061701 [Vitis vinifera]|uniref:RNase H type-1 domain-containing protein n=1 Tax=Vitis vinifera TaxID=29760 RepID=A0A438G837_VITVI|nr:hypothetical protein CK203_061701 [Vitis vinifera]
MVDFAGRWSLPSSGSGVGLLLQSPTGEHLEQAIRLGFPASNNEAEYEAILSGLDLALALSVSRLRVYSDSQLVGHLTTVHEWTIEKIKRTENGRADALAGIAASLPIKEAILLPIHVQANPSVAEASTCNTIEASQADGQEWTEDIIRSLSQCLNHSEALYLAELHEGYVETIRRSISGTGPIRKGPWPFAVGHGHSRTLPAQRAQKKFLLVATDYFSKWVEAEAYASIKDKDVTKRGSSKPKEVGGGATRRPVGLSNHTRTSDRKHSLRPRIRYGRIIPTEIGLPTIRTEAGRQDDANAELGRNLDWADEVRETASIRMADYQQRAAAHYNRKARPRSFKSGTLVLRREKIAVKITKRKALIGKASRNFPLTRGNRRDVPFDTMLLHAATVAEEYISSTASGIRLEFLPLRKLSLQLFFCAISELQILFCFFSIDTSVRSCLTSPSAGPSRSASCRRASVASSRSCLS